MITKPYDFFAQNSFQPFFLTCQRFRVIVSIISPMKASFPPSIGNFPQRAFYILDIISEPFGVLSASKEIKEDFAPNPSSRSMISEKLR